ncbi:unnamed protein product [Mytilus coruscus]|uniref:CCHC-type domain-containing protein n=1 Tax=Mytilus coruscus TaxID=42192 RepID=A0A6J8DCF8_MYTCO|nr:unnamed protein product [Mytilus coruscus]
MELAVLKRSVKVTISGPGRTKVTRETIISRLVGLLGNKTHLRSMWRTEAGPVWFATVETPEEADSLVDKRGVVGDKYSLVFTPCNRRRLHGSLEGYQAVMKRRRAILLSKLDTELASVMLRWTSGRALKFDILYRATINNRQCLITVPGRPPLCLKCGGLGHYRSDCQSGNYSKNRPGSYSDALRSLRSAAVSHDKVPDVSVEKGPPQDKSGQDKQNEENCEDISPDTSQENVTDDLEHSHSQR